MGPAQLFWLGRLFFLIQLIHGVVSWGEDGHYAICKMAEAYLENDAMAAVKDLLPDSANGDLAAVCSWADKVRYHYYWSKALHYVDTPDFRCNYNYDRDCHDSRGHKGRCVTGAILNYTEQLESYNSSGSAERYNLTEALMFLAHFIGDVHQPLHVGFIGDLGGNRITVRWFHRKTNLHHVWDTMIIESALKEFYDSDLSFMIQSIKKNITDGWLNEKSCWETCPGHRTVCPDVYASESVKLACKYAYRNATPGSTLQDEYFLSRLPIVEKRLAEAAVRLAATLNRIFTFRRRKAIAVA